MSTLSGALGLTLVHALWQDTILAGVLWVVLLRLRHRSPGARYLASCAGLAAMVIVPMLTLGVLYSSAPPAARNPAGTPGARAALVVVPEGDSRIWASPDVRQAWRSDPVPDWLLPAWLVGVAVCSLRLVSAGTHAAALRRRSRPADDAPAAAVRRLSAAMGVSVRIELRISGDTLGPATIGWLKPVILAPPAVLLGLTPQQLEAVLAHEIAHIRRHDYLVNLVQMAVETLFFYHPAVWWASSRIRIERELCCDDAAVKTCGDVVAYARALTIIARQPFTRPQTAIGAAGGSLVHRVGRLLAPAVPAHSGAGWSGALVFSLVLASAVLSARWAQGDPRRAETAAASRLATVVLTVYDPLGDPAEHVPVVFEQGAFQKGILFGEGLTDSSGRYTVRLPAGTYVFTAPIDFFPPTTVSLAAGETIRRDVRMQVDTLTASFTVCVRCPEDDRTDALPDSIVEELRQDREAASTELVSAAEPPGGWERYKPRVPRSLRQRDATIEGTVVVEGLIAADGRVVRSRALTAADPELAAAAVAAVTDQPWAPARVRGVPVDAPFRLTFQYVWDRGRR